MSVMSGDSDDRMVDARELLRFPAPARTKSYTPVAHRAVLDMVLNKARLAGLQPAVDTQDDPAAHVGIILAKKGMRMFAVARFKHRDGREIALGMRNSYDKSMSLGIATGQSVMVCSNMCFSGRDATFMRRHTGNAMVEFGQRVTLGLRKSRVEAIALERDFEALAQISCDLNQGFSAIGRAIGHGVITPTQGNRTFRHWREAELPEHERRDGWGLYNAFTQGLKHGEMRMERYAAVHTFLLEDAGIKKAA
jgi:hypothetical protein